MLRRFHFLNLNAKGKEKKKNPTKKTKKKTKEVSKGSHYDNNELGERRKKKKERNPTGFISLLQTSVRGD